MKGNGIETSRDGAGAARPAAGAFAGLGVLVCGDCPSGAGAAAEDLARVAREACPGAAVRVAARACFHPDSVRAALSAVEVRALVHLACGDEEASDILRRTAAAAAGIDPHGVRCADARPWGVRGEDEGRARARLRALGRRALAYPGSHPDQIALRLPGLGTSVSRRGFLSLLRPRYRVVPRIDPDRCAAGLGCRFCRGACPTGALRVESGRAGVIPQRCTGCGACVPACRFGAIRFPGWTTPELEAEVAGLLERAPGEPDAGVSPAVLFACEPALQAAAGGAAPLPAGVEAVALPCLDRLEPGLILLAAAGGARVVVLDCRGGCVRGCGLRGARRAVDFARQVLALAGRADRVSWWSEAALQAAATAGRASPAAGLAEAPVSPAPRRRFFPGRPLQTGLNRWRSRVPVCRRSEAGPASRAAERGQRRRPDPAARRALRTGLNRFPGAAEDETRPPAPDRRAVRCQGGAGPVPDSSLAQRVLRVAGEAGRGGAPLASGAVPFGLLAATDRCTLCGVCASRCPAGALRLSDESAPEQADGGARVVLRFDHGRCVACGFCVRDCPEGALRLRRALDTAALALPPRVLAVGEQARCGGCGAALGPARLRARAAADDGLCPRCRIGRCLGGLLPARGRAPGGGRAAFEDAEKVGQQIGGIPKGIAGH